MSWSARWRRPRLCRGRRAAAAVSTTARDRRGRTLGGTGPAARRVRHRGRTRTHGRRCSAAGPVQQSSSQSSRLPSARPPLAQVGRNGQPLNRGRSARPDPGGRGGDRHHLAGGGRLDRRLLGPAPRARTARRRAGAAHPRVVGGGVTPARRRRPACPRRPARCLPGLRGSRWPPVLPFVGPAPTPKLQPWQLDDRVTARVLTPDLSRSRMENRPGVWNPGQQCPPHLCRAWAQEGD